MILVDGYNLLFHERFLDPASDDPLEVRRGRLVKKMASVASEMGDRVAIVFDGDARLPEEARRVVFSGLEVRFSRQGTSADDEILEILRERKRPEDVLVFTDDRDLRMRVLAAGGHTRSSGPLAERIREPAPTRREPAGASEKPAVMGTDWLQYFDFKEDELEVRLDEVEVPLPNRLTSKLSRPAQGAPQKEPEWVEVPAHLSSEAVRAWLDYFGLPNPPRRD